MQLYSIRDFDERPHKGKLVELIHRPSGATGVCAKHLTRKRNKTSAYLQAVGTPEFQRWLLIEMNRKNVRLV